MLHFYHVKSHKLQAFQWAQTVHLSILGNLFLFCYEYSYSHKRSLTSTKLAILLNISRLFTHTK